MTTKRRKVTIKKFISPLSKKLVISPGGGVMNEPEQCVLPDGECEQCVEPPEQCTGPDIPSPRNRRRRNVKTAKVKTPIIKE